MSSEKVDSTQAEAGEPSRELDPIPGSIRARIPAGAVPAAQELLKLPDSQRAALFRAFNKAPPTQLRTVQVTQTSVWQGPLPPACELQRYNEVLPGGADRLLKLVENQQNHRFQLETMVATEQLRQSSNGQKYALWIGLGAIIAGSVLGYLGQPWLGGTMATSAMGGLATAFIYGKKQESKSRQAKAESNQAPDPKSP